MKTLILALFATTFIAKAAPAVVGQVAPDIAFSTGSATLTSGNFTTLTQSRCGAHEGSVIVLCYYTPW